MPACSDPNRCIVSSGCRTLDAVAQFVRAVDAAAAADGAGEDDAWPNEWLGGDEMAEEDGEDLAADRAWDAAYPWPNARAHELAWWRRLMRGLAREARAEARADARADTDTNAGWQPNGPGDEQNSWPTGADEEHNGWQWRGGAETDTNSDDRQNGWWTGTADEQNGWRGGVAWADPDDWRTGSGDEQQQNGWWTGPADEQNGGRGGVAWADPDMNNDDWRTGRGDEQNGWQGAAAGAGRERRHGRWQPRRPVYPQDGNADSEEYRQLQSDSRQLAGQVTAVWAGRQEDVHEDAKDSGNRSVSRHRRGGATSLTARPTLLT